MPNVLSVYDPLFYAQEALIALEKALGMAGRLTDLEFDQEPVAVLDQRVASEAQLGLLRVSLPDEPGCGSVRERWVRLRHR